MPICNLCPHTTRLLDKRHSSLVISIAIMSATLFSNARIFDGVAIISECGHVLVESNRISKISLREPLSPPSDRTIVDASGCTLIPGLMDAHMHVFQDVCLLEAALQYGVTTILDLHNEPEWFQGIHAITKQRNDVADVKSACFGATIKNGWPSAIVRLTSQEPNVSARGGIKQNTGLIVYTG